MSYDEWSDDVPRKGFGPQNGRSATKFRFTYQDIADATGLSLVTVRLYARRKLFNPKDLTSLARFVARRLD